MAGSGAADGTGVCLRGRAPVLVAATVSLALLLGPMTSSASAQEPAAETTTTSTTLGVTSTVPPSTTTTTADPDATTSTTSAAEAARAWRELVDAEAGNLPPASPGPLPAEEDVPPPPDAPPPVPPPGSHEAGLARARQDLRAAETALKKARVVELAAAKRLLPFGARAAAADDAVAALRADDRRVADELSSARDKVKKMAVAGYVRGGDSQPVDYLLRATDPIDLERRRTIVETATEARADAVDGYVALQREASLRLRSALAERDEARAAYAIAESELASAAAIAYLLAVDVEDKRQLLDHASASAIVGDTDIPRLFLDAYRSAATTLARRAPNCRVPWTAIAAIGKIESNHGRYRGAQFTLNGDVYPRILGIPLDGTRSALIRDTDLGVLDTDLEFDRAVGPMQFIPSTWARINEDGNRDGVSDPNNIYDAALGTAAYLCRAVPSGGLDTDEGLRPAFFSYNHSNKYVDDVLAWHHTYAGTPKPAEEPAPAAP